MFPRRNYNLRYPLLCCLGAILRVASAPGLAQSYPAEIGYTQTLTHILSRSDLNLTGSQVAVTSIACSADGSKVALLVSTCGALSEDFDCWHVYFMNGDGSGRVELTSGLPDGLGGLSFVQLNYDGSRLFLVSPLFGSVHSYYVCNTATGAWQVAVADVNGVGGRSRAFSLDRDGTRLYFAHDDLVNGECSTLGLYTASIGGTPTKILGLDQLPDSCNPNKMRFLGGGDNGVLIFTWFGDSCSKCTSMYVASGPAKRPNEATDYVWDLQNLPNRLITANGASALYYTITYPAGGGTEYNFSLVDLDTGAQTTIAERAISMPTLSRNGEYVRFEAVGNRSTLYEIATGDMADTLSYFTPVPAADGVLITDITDDDQRWFVDLWDQQDLIYRVDIEPDAGDYGAVPRVLGVVFGAPAILNDDTTPMTVYVTVSDPQGLDNIEYVRVISLGEYGREGAEWYTFFRTPLGFGGDSSSGDATDDGTNGDVTAGDGTYTLDFMRARSASQFYEHYTDMPIDAPIRILVKDKDGNYALADTLLRVTNDPNDLVVPPGDDDGNGTGNGDQGNDGTSTDGNGDGSVDNGGDGTGDGTANGGADGGNDGTNGQEEGSGGAEPGGGGAGLCPTAATLSLALSALGLALARGRRRR